MFATVTVYVVPLPVTDAMVPAAVPVVASAKSLAATPVTLSEKVTANCSLGASFKLAPTVVIDVTAGGVVSNVKFKLAVPETSPAPRD